MVIPKHGEILEAVSLVFIRLTLLTSLSSLPISLSPSVSVLVFLHFRGKKVSAGLPVLHSSGPTGRHPHPAQKAHHRGHVFKDLRKGIRNTFRKGIIHIVLQMQAAEEKTWKEAYGSHLQSICLLIPHSFKGSEMHSPTFYSKGSPRFSSVLYSRSRKKLSLLYLD